MDKGISAHVEPQGCREDPSSPSPSILSFLSMFSSSFPSFRSSLFLSISPFPRPSLAGGWNSALCACSLYHRVIYLRTTVKFQNSASVSGFPGASIPPAAFVHVLAVAPTLISEGRGGFPATSVNMLVICMLDVCIEPASGGLIHGSPSE